MSRTVDLVYAFGLACAVALAFALMACGAQPAPTPICDPAVAHRELVLCVTDADVPDTPEQMAQVVTWCAVRAALKSCPAAATGGK